MNWVTRLLKQIYGEEWMELKLKNGSTITWNHSGDDESFRGTPCPTCNGRGYVALGATHLGVTRDVCPDCHGTGSGGFLYVD